MKDTTSTLDTLRSCYPNLTSYALSHALKAVEDNKIYAMYLGNYLKHLDDYFCNQGDITMIECGLVPEDRQAFFERKLNAWLDFWSIEENTIIANHNLCQHLRYQSQLKGTN